MKYESVYLFDSICGELSRGDLIAERRLAAGDPSIMKLGDLLLCDKDEFPFEKGDYDLLSADDFDRERCIEKGRIALRAIEEVAGRPLPISTNVLKRMYILGLSPSRGLFSRGYKQRFSGFDDFKSAIESPTRFRQHRFDNWSIREFQTAASKIETQVGGKPSIDDYRDAVAAGQFPHRNTMERLLGGYNVVNELLGYPDVPAMSNGDIVIFGMDFLDENEEKKFITHSFDILAGKNRGPSSKTIQVKFGNFHNYRILVQERLNDKQERLYRYRAQFIENHKNPAYAKLSDDALLQRGARFELVSNLTPWMHLDQKLKLVNSRRADEFTQNFSKIAIKENKQLIEGYIEMEAERLGLVHYIWPRPAFYKDHIFVSDDELAERRHIHNMRVSARRAALRNKGFAA